MLQWCVCVAQASAGAAAGWRRCTCLGGLNRCGRIQTDCDRASVSVHRSRPKDRKISRAAACHGLFAAAKCFSLCPCGLAALRPRRFAPRAFASVDSFVRSGAVSFPLVARVVPKLFEFCRPSPCSQHGWSVPSTCPAVPTSSCPLHALSCHCFRHVREPSCGAALRCCPSVLAGPLC